MKNVLSLLAAVTISAAVQCCTPDKQERCERSEWTIVSTATTATVYNAVPQQCDDDYMVTASNYRIDKSKLENIRIAAMERTMMKRYGITYGSYILVQGAGSMDGIWRIEDTMNRRFAGQDKIDFLVPDDIRTGMWTNITVFKPANEYAEQMCKNLYNT